MKGEVSQYEFYKDAAKVGLIRNNRKAITNSKNVVELQPLVSLRAFIAGGEEALERVSLFWEKNGYRRYDK